MARTKSKAPLTELAGIFFISAALLALEICLTRIFAVMIWFHFSFLALGIVMLGFAFAGIVLVLFQKIEKTRATAAIAGLGFALASGLGVALMICQSMIFDHFYKLKAIHYFLVLSTPVYMIPLFLFALLMVVVFTSGFTCAGVAVAVMFAGRPRDVGRLYFANLVGGGLGSLLILPLLARVGALDAILAIILIILLGTFCFIGSNLRRSGWKFAACIAFAATVIAVMGITDSNTPFAESLLVRQDVTKENRLFRKWNSFSCVDFYLVDKKDPLYRESLWGLSRTYQGDTPELVKMIIDSWAVTAAYRMNDNTLDLPFYEYLPTNLAYNILSRPSVLVLGAGGGVDILSALHYRASSVTGVEINPSIVEAMRNELAGFSGDLYNRSDIAVHVAEGRHWLSRDRNTYDLIHLSGVDSLSGALSSAYCFSESYLYTIDAFSDYLAHLTDDGIVSLLRAAFTPRMEMEMLRLLTTASEALNRSGIKSPERHLMIVHSNVNLFAVLLVKKKPLTPAQMHAIDIACKNKGFSVLYSPDRRLENAFYSFFRASDKRHFYDRYPFKVTPVTEDKPFFFNFAKVSNVFRPPDMVYLLYFIGEMVLWGGTFLALILLPVFVVWPVKYFRKRKIPVRRPWVLMTYFMGIGIAFMMVENIFIQRFTIFLGQPVYSLSLVLFCMMVFAGMGSYWSGLSREKRCQRILVACGIPALLLVTFLIAEIVFSVLLHAGLFTRLMASAVMLAPCCFLMGLPFPYGIRRLEINETRAIPWAWALNSYASVLGAFLAVIGNINLGFTATCTIAAVIYAACGALLFQWRPLKNGHSFSGSNPPL